jgi:hypothetical protein
VDIDTVRWSGDGEFTQLILDALRAQPQIATIRVEDAPASRDDVGYSFISNELFVVPVATQRGAHRRWGVWPIRRKTAEPSFTLRDVEAVLTAHAAIGAPDVSDEGMLQYLRTQRIVPAYQTRGYKLVELIRIYISENVRTP